MVERDVIRHDERRVGGDAKALFDVGHAHGNEFVDFTEERFRREHDAVAEVADAVGMHDARGDQAEDGLLAVDDERVTRVVTAVEAHDAVGLLGEPVNDLALAFVAPLSADHDYILAHLCNSYWVGNNCGRTHEGARPHRKNPVQTEGRATSPEKWLPAAFRALLRPPCRKQTR